MAGNTSIRCRRDASDSAARTCALRLLEMRIAAVVRDALTTDPDVHRKQSDWSTLPVDDDGASGVRGRESVENRIETLRFVSEDEAFARVPARVSGESLGLRLRSQHDVALGEQSGSGALVESDYHRIRGALLETIRRYPQRFGVPDRRRRTDHHVSHGDSREFLLGGLEHDRNLLCVWSDTTVGTTVPPLVRMADSCGSLARTSQLRDGQDTDLRGATV